MPESGTTTATCSVKAIQQSFPVSSIHHRSGGVFKSKAMYSVDGGMQKAILKGKGNLKVSVSDIFNTMKWTGSSDFSGQTNYVIAKWESRQFRMNFSYRFGSSQVKAARQRKDAVEEERKRTQASGGFGGQ